jgi:PAS domain S-box-containing protein
MRDNIQTDRRKHDLYRVLFENVYGGLVVIDISTGNIKDVNKQAIIMFGYEFDEITTLNFRDLLCCPEKFEDIVSGNFEKFEVFLCKRKNNMIFPVKLNATQINIEQDIFVLSVLYDLSSEKEKEDALLVSEIKYRTILNNMRDVVFEYSPIDFKITYISPSCERFGFAVEEVIGTSIFDFIYIDDVDKIKLSAEKLLNTRLGRPLVFRLKTKTDKIKWLEINSDLVIDKYNNIISIVGVARDITQSKLLQENIIKSENRYRAIVEDQIELIYRFNKDGIITFANDAYCRYFETNKADVIGKHYYDLIPSKLRNFVKKSFASLTPEKQFNKYDSEIVLSDGRSRWIHWVDRIIIHKDMEDEYQSIGFDITDRKELEYDLKRNRDKYRAILDNLQDGFYQITPTGNVCFLSGSSLEILGYSNQQELLGKSICDIFVNPEEYKSILSRIKVAGGKLYEYETELFTKSGKKIIASINIQVIYDKIGNIVTIQGIFRDITKVKQQLSEILKLYQIVEGCQSGLIVIELDGAISYANHVVLNIMKCTISDDVKECLIGKKAKSFIIFDNGITLPDICSIVEKEGKWFGTAYIFCPYSNGNKIPIDIMFSRVKINQETFTVASFNDISERLELNRKIKEQSELYEELHENMSVLVEKMSSFNEVKFKEITELEEAFSKSIKDFTNTDEGGNVADASI